MAWGGAWQVHDGRCVLFVVCGLWGCVMIQLWYQICLGRL